MKPIFSWRALRFIFWLTIGLLVIMALLAIANPAKAAGEDCEAHKIVELLIYATTVQSPATAWYANDQTLTILTGHPELMEVTLQKLGLNNVSELRTALTRAGFKSVVPNRNGAESWKFPGRYENPCLPPTGKLSSENHTFGVSTAEGDIGFSMSWSLASLGFAIVILIFGGALCIPRPQWSLPSSRD